MSALVSFSIDVTKIDKNKIKDGKWLNLTLSIDDQTNQWGQNASCYHAQSKEEREAKANRTYLGNGKVVWNDGNIKNAEQQPHSASTTIDNAQDDLPF